MFRDILAIIITVLMFSLWVIPAVMMVVLPDTQWGALYIPIVGVTIAWGWVVYNWYFNR